MSEALERHPSLAISRRTNLWTYFLDRFGDLDDPDNLDRCLEAMISFTRIRAMNPDAERLREEFLQSGPRTYVRLFRLLGDHYARSIGKDRWGDKSLNCELDAELILSSYPDAVMIQLLRDPRDRHVSVRDHRGGRRGGVYGSIAVWRRSARRAISNRARFGDRYRTVRYEDLVADPEAVLRDVCAWLGERFDARMLERPADDARSGTARQRSVGFHERSVGRHRRDLSARHTALIERLSGREMAHFGYQRSNVELRPSSAVRLAVVDRPAATLFSRVWSPWSNVKRRFGRPSRRRTVRTT